MLRIRVVVMIGLLAVMTAASRDADARGIGIRRGIVGLATLPLRIVTGGLPIRHGGHRSRPARRAIAARRHHVPTAAAVTTAVAAAPATTAMPVQQAGRTALPFWPSAYDDLVNYVFATGEGDRLWTHGLNDIFDGLFGSSNERQRGPVGCGDPPATGTAAIDRISRTVEPTEAQRPAFDALRAALTTSAQRFAAGCKGDVSATPQRRIDLMNDRLWTMRQFVITMREPLQNVYGVLTEDQKKKLATPAEQGQTADANTSPSCGESDLSAAGWAPIEKTAKPGPAQREAFEALRMSFTRGAAFLKTLCPKTWPADLPGRLDAADGRINALTYTVGLIGSAADVFYGSLSEQQKKRLPALAQQP